MLGDMIEIVDEGYKAYINDCECGMGDNPYNYITHPEEHEAWEEGWLLACNNERD